jgi:hypothetical protein
MTCQHCESAKKAFNILAQHMPREEVQMLSVVCRFCHTEWHAIPEEKP